MKCPYLSPNDCDPKGRNEKLTAKRISDFLVIEYFNSRGTEIFPFSYFENPWLECELVIKDINNIHNFHKTTTYGLYFG